MEKWQEQFTGLDTRLSELSAKAAKAAAEVKAANASKREEINE